MGLFQSRRCCLHEEQKTSLDAQMDYYRQMIDANDDWEYAGTFADRGISGTSVKRREQFLKMMEACEEGRIDLILTKSISRFARNTVDSVQMLRRLKELDVEVFFQKENIWTSRSEGDVSTPAFIQRLRAGTTENA